jgi:hypothetical protein
VIYTREQAEQSAKYVGATLEHRCAVQVRGKEPLAQSLACAIIAGYELAKEHHERSEEFIQSAVALGFGGCAYGGVVSFDCIWEVMGKGGFEEAVRMLKGIVIWWRRWTRRGGGAGEGPAASTEHRLGAVDGTVVARV